MFNVFYKHLWTTVNHHICLFTYKNSRSDWKQANNGGIQYRAVWDGEVCQCWCLYKSELKFVALNAEKCFVYVECAPAFQNCILYIWKATWVIFFQVNHLIYSVQEDFIVYINSFLFYFYKLRPSPKRTAAAFISSLKSAHAHAFL